MADPVRVNLAPMIRYRERITAGLQRGGGDSNPVRRAFRQWAHIYRSFLQLRYNRFSRGGGNWPGLRPSTLAARARRPGGRLKRAFAAGDITEKQFKQRMKAASRKNRKTTERLGAAIARGDVVMEAGHVMRKNLGSFAGSFSILRDQGILFNVTAPTFTNAPGQLQRDIEYGIKVGYGGPSRHPDGTATIADIASFHQEGKGRLPVRKIIAPPDRPTRERMAREMDRALRGIR